MVLVEYEWDFDYGDHCFNDVLKLLGPDEKFENYYRNDNDDGRENN